MALTHFGKALRQIRINRGILLKDMADALSYKCPYLSKIETGEEPIPTDLIAKLFEVYDLSDAEIASLIEPCPFCNGEAEHMSHEYIGHVIKCSRCGNMTPWHAEIEEAFEAWNRRVGDE